MYADVSVDMYDSIKLSRTMLSDHFLPKYLEALEDVVWSMKKKKRTRRWEGWRKGRERS